MLLPTAVAGALALAVPGLLAQGVTLQWTPASPVPGALQSDLRGPANLPFLSLLDFAGGPQTVLGERLHLGLTPFLTVSDAGLLDGGGRHVGSLAVPPIAALAGLSLYHQSAVLDATAPNGVFRASNPQSSCLYGGAAALVFDFETPAGFTGSFDASVRGRLQGGAVQQRSVSTIDPQGVVFPQPLLMFNPLGSRLQMVYRPQDLGSAGDEELVLGLEWKVRNQPLIGDHYPRITLDLGHTDIAPDYRHDPFSALPMFPNSGLGLSFAGNYKPGTTATRVYDGPYSMLPGNLQPGGYLPYPALQQPFVYNGRDSLLIDLRTFPSAQTGGFNGSEARLMSTSSPDPGARAAIQGRVGAPIDPSQANAAQSADNAMHDLRITFLRTRTVATSSWQLGSSLLAPDYQAPVIAATRPAGTVLAFEYRGADDGFGARQTPWSPSVDVADGFRFLQVRITFVGDALTGEVPSVDTLVIPSR